MKHSLTWGHLFGGWKSRRNGMWGVELGVKAGYLTGYQVRENQSPRAQPNQICRTQWDASVKTSSDLWTLTSLCFGRGQGVASTSPFGMFSPEGRVFKPRSNRQTKEIMVDNTFVIVHSFYTLWALFKLWRWPLLHMTRWRDHALIV